MFSCEIAKRLRTASLIERLIRELHCEMLQNMPLKLIRLILDVHQIKLDLHRLNENWSQYDNQLKMKKIYVLESLKYFQYHSRTHLNL